MNIAKSFYPYKSDQTAIIKKDKAEINNWANNLEYISEELEQLITLERQLLNNSDLLQQLHSIRRENTLRLGSLYKYEGAIRNSINDDKVSCDTFYLNNHEKNRNMYVEHIKKYRTIKTKVFTRIVEHAKDAT
ncbi:hypothetical protein GH721_05580 [Kriegella sp. EG-1]|nr:hypothetical protein [Flavobacteriaceae bacterium EG-1]